MIVRAPDELTPNPDDVPAAFAAYQQERYPRTMRVPLYACGLTGNRAPEEC